MKNVERCTLVRKSFKPLVDIGEGNTSVALYFLYSLGSFGSSPPHYAALGHTIKTHLSGVIHLYDKFLFLSKMKISQDNRKEAGENRRGKMEKKRKGKKSENIM